MSRGTPQTMRLVEYATASMIIPGESESGDRYIAAPTPTGALIAVIDGLGHGVEAAEASKVAVATLERYASESVIALIRRCNEAMKTTRGAVMSLASFSAQNHTMTCLGVGNVEGVLLRTDAQAGQSRESILMRGGVVGFRLPTLRALVMPVSPGDILILATDGIRSGFEINLSISAPLQQIADTICSQHGKGTDDALVLVARYMGDGS